jgi:hypothetical protein
MKHLFAAIALLTAPYCATAETIKERMAGNPNMELGDVVQSAEVAGNIAFALASPRYGEETVRNEQPFIVTLNNGIWEVRGQMPPSCRPNLCVGGVLEIDIQAVDGKVVRLRHTK